jgi:hypothetical protein
MTGVCRHLASVGKISATPAFVHAKITVLTLACQFNTVRAMESGLQQWKGGRLRLFMPFSAVVGIDGERVDRWPVVGADGKQFERQYEPLGGGWAIRADRPLRVTLDEPDELRGLHVLLDMRDGVFQCVGVLSEEGTTALTTTVLRRLGPLVKDLARKHWTGFVVQLFELEDGSIAAKLPWAVAKPDGRVVQHAQPSEEALAEHDRRVRRPGRRPLSDALLEEVVETYRKAERSGAPRIEGLRAQFPGYSDETLRNWVRKARERGFLGRAPSVRIAGEQREEEPNG